MEGGLNLSITIVSDFWPVFCFHQLCVAVPSCWSAHLQNTPGDTHSSVSPCSISKDYICGGVISGYFNQGFQQFHILNSGFLFLHYLQPLLLKL